MININRSTYWSRRHSNCGQYRSAEAELWSGGAKCQLKVAEHHRDRLVRYSNQGSCASQPGYLWFSYDVVRKLSRVNFAHSGHSLVLRISPHLRNREWPEPATRQSPSSLSVGDSRYML
eukprot:6204641-Pleurochrysis_carterae.AAC.4